MERVRRWLSLKVLPWFFGVTQWVAPWMPPWMKVRAHKPHPFRMLLYLEWALLSISLINPLFIEVIGFAKHEGGYINWWLSLLPFQAIVIVFGLMGLYLPRAHMRAKVVYTALEFVLIGLAGHVYYWDSVCLASMLLVAAIRSCLVFKRDGRAVIAGAIFIFFVMVNQASWPGFIEETTLIIEAPVVTDSSGEGVSEELVREELIRIESSSTLASEPSEDGVFETVPYDLALLQVQLQNVFFFGLVLFFVLLLVNALLAEQENRRRLAEAHTQLYEYAGRIEDQATLQERNRIARDIHDALGHILTAQSIQLDNGLFFLKDNLPKAQSFLQASKQLSTEALKELRRSITSLRDEPLSAQPLEEAIARCVDNFRQVAGIAIDCEVTATLPVSAKVRTAVLRIVEEALTNIQKHSQATQVNILVHTHVSQGEQPVLSFTIEDNGVGFWIGQTETGFGLRGMRERALALGGQLEIRSQLGMGCRVFGSFPLGFSAERRAW